MDKNKKSDKLLGLEIFRFLCAASVLLYHYQHFSYKAYTPFEFSQAEQPFYSILGPVYDYGYYGVQLFWCISGFIFFWKYRNAISQNRTSAREFFLNRFSRLYPLHLTTLLAVAALQYFYLAREGHYFVSEINDLYHFILQVFLASNWVEQQGSFNSPIWSISVEVIAYFLFFILLRYVSSSYILNIAVISTCIALKIFHFELKVIDCIMYFYAGGLAGIFSNRQYGKSIKQAVCALIIIFLVFLTAVFFVLKVYELKYSQGVFVLLTIPLLLFVLAELNIKILLS